MAELASVSRDWNGFKKRLKVTKYQSLRVTKEEQAYAVAKISRWSREYDDGKSGVSVSSTEADRQIGFLLNLVRDTGVTVIVKKGRNNDIIIEPGKDWLEHLAARLGGADEEEIRRAILHGPIGDLVGGDPRRLRRKLVKLRRQESEWEERLGEFEAERDTITRKLERAEKDRANAVTDRMQREQEVLSLRRQLDAAQERIRQLHADRMSGEAGRG